MNISQRNQSTSARLNGVAKKYWNLQAMGMGLERLPEYWRYHTPQLAGICNGYRYKAKEQIRKYIDEQVPLEYHKTLTGLQNIIKSMSDIISKSSDNREIMQASGIKMQALNMKMELVSSANLVHEAIHLVERYRGYTASKSQSVNNSRWY